MSALHIDIVKGDAFIHGLTKGGHCSVLEKVEASAASRTLHGQQKRDFADAQESGGFDARNAMINR